jgi:cytochrome c551/c552
MKKSIVYILVLFCFMSLQIVAQDAPAEQDFYKIITLPVPEGILLEVGGIATLPTGDVAIATRRGDVWIVNNPYGSAPNFKRFASGLHEILGLTYQNGALYCAQRGELTRLVDGNGDGRADLYETIYAWPLSGHYHEYSFGPAVAPDGSFFVTCNVAFGDEEWWRGESKVPYRGWTIKISPDGQVEPWATGMRSPCGYGIVDGELFYDDNQGDWIGSGALWHVSKGSFTGHPAGLAWTDKLPNSPVKLTDEQLYTRVDQRKIRGADGTYIKPENIVNEKPLAFYELKSTFPEVRVPAVWLPHGVLGISNSQIVPDQTNGKFGPFAGQVFVGDQGQSKIMRVALEKVKGEYQGVAFDFRSGFQSGVLRMCWGNDGSMFVGETNRGWGSAGEKAQGIQRLVWNGRMPFEMKTVRAMPDGFEVEFTLPVDRKSAEDLSNYDLRSFIYKYHPVYGSPTVNEYQPVLKGVSLSADGMRLRLVVDGLKQYYIHEMRLTGIRDAVNKFSLVHPTAYYTLNQIPDGEKLATGAMKTFRSKAAPATTKPGAGKGTAKPATGAVATPDAKGKPAANKPAAKAATAVTYEEVKPLLAKHTCVACHQQNKRQVGPSFADIAKRKYSNEQIVQLIYNPKPSNWPDYATPMAPMPQVPKADALKIAAWINTLK